MELLRRTRNIVRPGGLLLVVNTVTRELVQSCARCPRPFMNAAGDVVVLENPRFDPIRSSLHNKWTFYRRRGKDLLCMDEISFTLRIYTLTELAETAEATGWRLEAAYHNPETLEPPRPEGSPINAVFRRTSS
jgi:hypothetical protein